MLKYAEMTTLDVVMAPERGRLSLLKDAHRHKFNYTPRHGMLYVRSRMISSRCNDNFDEFPAPEIEQGWPTFIGKPAFVNHHNDDHRRARGVIIAAALHRDLNPDGSPDFWAEGLHELDALTFPKLAQAILAGHIERTSMGVDVKYSVCSACNNIATTPLEYCAHVPGQKGKQLVRVTASGARKGILIREACYGLNFFENSFLVEPPADPTAFTLGKPVAGPGLDHLTRSAQRIVVNSSRKLIVSQGQIPQRAVDPRSLVDQPIVTRKTALRLVEGTVCLACRSRETIADIHGNAECMGCGHCWHEGAKQEALRAEAAKYENVEDHPWFQAHPVNHQHIVDHWNRATPDEKASGKRWYADAHLVARGIGTLAEQKGIKHPEGSTHLAAGVLANHSPQNGWEANMHDAARVLYEGKGLGGKGSGILATARTAENDDRMLAGEPYYHVLQGSKINDFAHLIEHGGDKDPEIPHIVIDRHALGVATGEGLSDEEYDTAPLSGSKRKDGTRNRRNYDHVVGEYHKAAAEISRKEKEPIAGHQVQAVTWLVRQRENEQKQHDLIAAGEDARLNRGRETVRNKAKSKWEDFRSEHLPHMDTKGPGTGYLASRHEAYGETKAPADVDTLRDENCPVCGEQDSWDGNACPVCNYVAPPKQFQDPDLELAKKLDLRKQQQDFENSMQPAQQEMDAQAVGDVQPDLVCDNCGAEFSAGEPMTTDTEDPQDGDASAQLNEGDVCPACGKGILETGTDLAAERGAVPGQDEEAPDEDAGDTDKGDGKNKNDDSGPVDPRDLVDSDDDSGDDDDTSDDDKPAKGKKSPFKK